MKTVTLANLTWRAHSPSLFQLLGADAAIAYNGQAWLVAVHGVYGSREFATRQQAAELIGQAFATAQGEAL